MPKPDSEEKIPTPNSNEQMPIPSSLVDQADQEIPGPSHMVGNAPPTPFRMDEAGSSPAVAAPANCPESAAAAAAVKVAKPAVQSPSMLTSGPLQGAALLHRQIFRPPFFSDLKPSAQELVMMVTFLQLVLLAACAYTAQQVPMLSHPSRTSPPVT